MDNIFLQFALVLALSCIYGFVAYKLKLPLVIAYLLSGVTVSVFRAFDIHDGVFSVLPEIGIAFVLFLIGMELDLREIKSLGKPIMVGTTLQIIISTIAGMAIAGMLGFNQTESFYLALGLSFSSTIVVVKLLLEKRDLMSLYGKLSIGILLLEDLVAVAVLMGISVGSSFFQAGLQQSLPLLGLGLKALLLFLATFVLSKYVLNSLFGIAARSVELLFLTALTWCFVFTTAAILAGFSIVIGAFLAGVALASSAYKLQIQGKVKPLRDFFVMLFFVYLGSQININDIMPNIALISSFTVYALVAKPMIFLVILGIFGFKKHTLFNTSVSLSSVSEFSLVILLVGAKSGIVPQSLLSIMASVAVLSVILSSVAITYSKQVYKILSPVLAFFEHKSLVHKFESGLVPDALDKHIVVIGANRFGTPIVKFLKKEEIPFIVTDLNPHIVEQLQNEDINAVYGDIGDSEVLDKLGIEQARLVISTVSDLADNELLLSECKRRKVQAKIIVRAAELEDADILKRLGADYIIVPEKVSGDYLVNQLKDHWPLVHFTHL